MSICKKSLVHNMQKKKNEQIKDKPLFKTNEEIEKVFNKNYIKHLEKLYVNLSTKLISFLD